MKEMKNHLTYPLLLYSSVIHFPVLILLNLLLTSTVTCVSGQSITASSAGGQQQQAISFAMRKLSSSSNQFGFDLIRSMDRSSVNMAICPFCVFSSLTMILTGADGTTATALRHALYLWGMQSEEINLASYDLMNHLGVNLPPHARSAFSRRSTNLRDHHHHQHHHHLTSTTPSTTTPFSMASRVNFSSLLNSNSNSLNNQGSSDLAFLTNIYVQRDFPINYHFHMLLQRFFKTVVHPLDFQFNGEETRQHINAIVEKQTFGKIRDILPDRKSPATQMLLLSALYFKGMLDLNMVPVSPNVYIPRIPMVASGERSQGKMATAGTAYVTASSNVIPTPDSISLTPEMTTDMIFGPDPVILEARAAKLRYKFDRYLNCTTVEMPFKNSLITLVLMMPGDYNLEILLTRLSAQILSDVVSSLEVKRLNIRMPRLNFEQSSANLTWALSNLGLTDLFKPGFSQLHGISDYKWLAVSDIISKTYLDIKENPSGVPPVHSSGLHGIHSASGNGGGGGHVVHHHPPPVNSHHNSVPPKHQVSGSGHSGQQMSHITNLLNTHAEQHQQPTPALFHHHPNQNINHLSHPFSLPTINRIKYPLNPNRHRNQQQQQQQPQPGASQGPSASTSSSSSGETIDVNFNKPFIYFVIDTVSGLIMVMGKVGRDPVSYRLPI